MGKLIRCLYLAIFCVIISCNGADYNLTGKIVGFDYDSLTVEISDITTQKLISRNVIPIGRGGRFHTTLPKDSIIMGVSITPVNNKIDVDSYLEKESMSGNEETIEDINLINEKMNHLRTFTYGPFYFVPGDRMEILVRKDGGINVSGTALYDKVNSLKELNALQRKVDGLHSEMYRNLDQRQPDKKVTDSLRDAIDNVYNLITKEKLSVIKENSNDNIAAYMLLTLGPEQYMENIGCLGSGVKQGPFRQLLGKIYTTYAKEQEKEARKARISSGKKAPDFKLPDRWGKEMTLSSFKGKYLLLDIWSRFSNIEKKNLVPLEKFYAGHRNKLQIACISLGKSESEWKEDIKKYRLPWISLYNAPEDKTFLEDYALDTFPVRILIDPEGTIVDLFYGNKELLHKLEELF